MRGWPLFSKRNHNILIFPIGMLQSQFVLNISMFLCSQVCNHNILLCRHYFAACTGNFSKFHHGKPWHKKFLFGENFGNFSFPRSLKWVFIGDMTLLIFITIIGKNLGIISQVIPKVVNDMGTFSQVILKVVNDMGRFSQVILKVVNDMETFSQAKVVYYSYRCE